MRATSCCDSITTLCTPSNSIVDYKAEVASLDKPRGRPYIPRNLSELVISQFLPGAMAKNQALASNMGVDYVIVFRYATTGE